MANQDVPGKPKYYDPRRIFDWGPDSGIPPFTAENYPRPLADGEEFPFRPPKHNGTPIPYSPSYGTPLVGSIVRVQPNSKTLPAKSVFELYKGPATRLDSIRYGPKIIARLAKYPLSNEQAIAQNAINPNLLANHPVNADVGDTWNSTWEMTEGNASIPSATKQVEALEVFHHQISGIAQSQFFKWARIVNGEEDVIREVDRQWMEPIRVMCRMRYDRNAGNSGEGPGRSWKVAKGLTRAEREEVKQHAEFPYWGPAVPKDTKAPSGAGQPDFVVHVTASHIGSVGEGKHAWGMEARNLRRVIRAEDGSHLWGHTSTAALLLRQIWGELVWCTSRFGFWTNGRSWVFYVRNRVNEISFSDFLEWSDPEVLRVLTGMTYVSSDAILTATEANLEQKLWEAAGKIAREDELEDTVVVTSPPQ
ncbi:hypothetical protein OF83DRAFT_1180301 [Amylostereum chailletii]|nr:hypothetical protein OF83DRAFT_1180301 [Amylostereum chailletii]